ncbi:adenosine deaminase/editase [Morchella snyderi]|nr:adenosine deaminase/editase [Morchella snyderi]
MGELEDAIARAVISAYNALPAKSKPKPRPDATEWVPLSGVVLETGEGEVVCAALGTGMKCLPHSKIPLAKGLVLHDCHAERVLWCIVIAIRAFNCFIIEECFKLASNSTYTSQFVRRRSPEDVTEDSPQPFTIRSNVKVHFYSSEAPCGDASMELTMSAQSDATPWALHTTTAASHTPATITTTTSPTPLTPTTTLLRGRGYFSSLGTVRTKPGRADSPPTLSKSCSDKLSLRQCTSLLLTPAALLVSPHHAYTSTVVLPETEYSATAVQRAFSASGRMAPLTGRGWRGGYEFRPFTVRTTGMVFGCSKKEAERATPRRAVGSNVTAVWVRGAGSETLIGGVLQGRKQWAGVAGASRVCKARVWKAVSVVAGVLGEKGLVGAVRAETYEGVKRGVWMAERRRVKEETRKVLGGWERNGGGEFGMME